MKRATAAVVLAACASTAPGLEHSIEAAGVRPADLSVKDREILQADERRKPFFPESDPHLLPAVRDALDRPLAVSAAARRAIPGGSLLRAQAALRDYYPHAAEAGEAPAATALEGLDALEPEAARAVARLHAAAARAAAMVEAALSGLSAEERALLRKTLPRWVRRTEPGEKERALAGEEETEERDALLRCAEAAGKIDRAGLLAAWAHLVAATESALPALMRQGELETKPIVIDTPEGPVVVRGTRTDGGEVDALLLVDFGGDDEYKLPADRTDRPVRVVIDLGGDDLYLSRKPLGWGAALLGLSLHVDLKGDDDYRGGDWSLGCGLAGCGALWDLQGNDRYYGGLGAEGVGIFGSGTLLDGEGDDEYVAGCFCQGFGSTGGFGAILDRGGDDAYTAGRDEEDIWRREATFITFAQGSGFGHRFGHVLQDEGGGRRWNMTGQLPGGVGILFDAGGDDRYEADVFGQGSAYWYSLGLLVDGGGNDRYRATWYGQGVGTHAAVGAVVDLAGDDWYFSRNTSQGCGHDFSVGILHDLRGNDRYRGMALCQGAGNAWSGLGILADEGGNDDYRCGDRCWGFGSAEEKMPEAAPYGFFLDLGGEDRFEGGPKGLDRGAGRWRQGERGHGEDRP